MFIGVMLYCTVQALGELAVIFPVAGSFSAFATRFLDPSWGFAMGWKYVVLPFPLCPEGYFEFSVSDMTANISESYALQWLVVLPLEIIAAAMTIDYWDVTVNKAVFVTAFLFVIISINLFGAKAYGEAEFIFAIVKITAVIGFM